MDRFLLHSPTVPAKAATWISSRAGPTVAHGELQPLRQVDWPQEDLMHDARLGMLVLCLQVSVSTASAEVATQVVRFTHGDVL